MEIKQSHLKAFSAELCLTVTKSFGMLNNTFPTQDQCSIYRKSLCMHTLPNFLVHLPERLPDATTVATGDWELDSVKSDVNYVRVLKRSRTAVVEWNVAWNGVICFDSSYVDNLQSISLFKFVAIRKIKEPKKWNVTMQWLVFVSYIRFSKVGSMIHRWKLSIKVRRFAWLNFGPFLHLIKFQCQLAMHKLIKRSIGLLLLMFIFLSFNTCLKHLM